LKRKYFFVVLFLMLVIFLAGCGSEIVTDEVKVKSVIQNYFLAINNQNWSKAKSYCIYDSEAYYDTCDLEDIINTFIDQYTSATLTYFVDISNVSVIGSYASAYYSGSLTITADPYSESGSISGYYYLQKVVNTWKIYGYDETD